MSVGGGVREGGGAVIGQAEIGMERWRKRPWLVVDVAVWDGVRVGVVVIQKEVGMK